MERVVKGTKKGTVEESSRSNASGARAMGRG